MDNSLILRLAEGDESSAKILYGIKPFLLKIAADPGSSADVAKAEHLYFQCLSTLESNNITGTKLVGLYRLVNDTGAKKFAERACRSAEEKIERTAMAVLALTFGDVSIEHIYKKLGDYLQGQKHNLDVEGTIQEGRRCLLQFQSNVSSRNAAVQTDPSQGPTKPTPSRKTKAGAQPKAK